MVLLLDLSPLISGSMRDVAHAVVWGQRTDPWRFSGRMGWKLREHWRKSSQWFALTRKHAQLVLEDTHVLDLFQRYCQNAWDNDVNRCLAPCTEAIAGDVLHSCLAMDPYTLHAPLSHRRASLCFAVEGSTEFEH